MYLELSLSDPSHWGYPKDFNVVNLGNEVQNVIGFKIETYNSLKYILEFIY